MKKILIALILLITSPLYAASIPSANSWTISTLAGTEINTGALAPDYGAVVGLDVLKSLSPAISFGLESQFADTITASGTPQEMLSFLPSIRIYPVKNLFIDAGIGPAFNTQPMCLVPGEHVKSSAFSIAKKLDFGLSEPITPKLNMIIETGVVFDSLSAHIGPFTTWSNGTAADFSLGYVFAMVGFQFGL